MAERPRLIRKIDIADARELAARRCDAGFSESSPAKHVDVCVESDEDRGSIPLASSIFVVNDLRFECARSRNKSGNMSANVRRRAEKAGAPEKTVAQAGGSITANWRLWWASGRRGRSRSISALRRSARSLERKMIRRGSSNNSNTRARVLVSKLPMRATQTRRRR